MSQLLGDTELFKKLLQGLIPGARTDDSHIEVVPVMYRATWRAFEAGGKTPADALTALYDKLRKAVIVEWIADETLLKHVSGGDLPGMYLSPPEALEFVEWSRQRADEKRKDALVQTLIDAADDAREGL